MFRLSSNDGETCILPWMLLFLDKSAQVWVLQLRTLPMQCKNDEGRAMMVRTQRAQSTVPGIPPPLCIRSIVGSSGISAVR
mmetsp:Transcript_2367/g.3546  ORF Transcript_2367/g.3546 Transcript_2367/m.3546 type:complete len:81 (-) Transcript_2367:9-251(-)